MTLTARSAHGEDHQNALRIAMLVYPGMTLLDFAGPQSALELHGETYLVWKDMGAVLTDSGVTILPTHTFESCPTELDALFVPGGFGVESWVKDESVLSFLISAADNAGYITSVCSGSFLLAAAGLLQGYRATAHWSGIDVLAAMGVDAVRERVVIDRNRMTGGGVTAGIDFGLTLLGRLRGDMIAKATQLGMEYEPTPPYSGGTPDTVEPEVLDAWQSILTTKLASIASQSDR